MGVFQGRRKYRNGTGLPQGKHHGGCFLLLSITCSIAQCRLALYLCCIYVVLLSVASRRPSVTNLGSETSRCLGRLIVYRN